MDIDFSEAAEIDVEVQALNLEGIKHNLLNYIQDQAKIDIADSVDKADKSAKSAEAYAGEAATSATTASECAEQTSENLGLYYKKSETDVLLNTKAAKATTLEGYGITDAYTRAQVDSSLSGKASTSLDNLSADGQMIVDSQNGTISNCVLEIPQNIKVTLENNVLTLKSGSECVVYGSTYQTVTKGSDLTRVFSNSGTNRTIVIMPNTTLTYMGFLDLSHITSGESFPSDLPSSGQYGFYKVSEKQLYETQDGGTTWSVSGRTYPICIINIDSNGVASFAKDSNGNDMIFNGAGFVGHHAFVYPNVKALIPDGFNDDGSLKSVELNNNALRIFELVSGEATSGACRTVSFHRFSTQLSLYDLLNKDYNNLDGFTSNVRGYIKSENMFYRYNLGVYESAILCRFITYTYDGTTVTDFAIRQPYQGARNLLTDDLYKQIGDVETLLATV